MPVTKSAAKAMLQANKRRERNLVVKNDMTIGIKVLLKKVKSKEGITPADVSKVHGLIDKAYQKNIIHKNNAARKKSRIATIYNGSLTA